MTAAGRFVWFEYTTNDAARTQGFFGEVFGWTTKAVPMPDGEYTMIAAPDGTTIGGYRAGDSASWLPYLRVDNVADTAAQVTRLGGAVQQAPFKVGDFATMAVVADPHGASFALWQPTRTEEPAKPGVGHFGWAELPSKDPAASVAFYAKIGGFTSTAKDMGGLGTYHVLENGGQSRAGIMAQQGPQPHAWVPYVLVASADQTADKLKRLGATLAVPPTDIPNVGRFAIFVNPKGNATGILQAG